MRRLFTVFIFFIALSSAQVAHASYMSPISDLIGDSAPNASTPHIITFTVTNAIPAGGTITITPEGAFSLPVSFDFTDVDLAVSNGGPYVDRDLAAAASGSEDGVSIVSGTSGSITIRLSSGSGIAGGSLIRVILGTNATYQTTGDVNPINPTTPASYRIRVETSNGGAPIDFAKAMIVVVRPVTLTLITNDNAPIVSNALPSGTVPGGSAVIELSFQTNVIATCRYATSSGVSYASMTHNFSSVGGQLFYTVVSGHADATGYSYFIRCRDQFGATAQSDYELSFAVGTVPSITVSDGNTPGGGSETHTGGSGGSGGAGSFAGGSALLFQSSVTISGSAPANSSVTILKDGTQQKAVQATGEGAFTATLTGLDRGTYTFLAFATVGDQKSSRFSSTITLNSGTNNGISGVLLSPTIKPDADTVDIGSDVHVSGIGVPGTVVGVTARDVPAEGQAGVAKDYSASTTASGAWEITIPSKEFKRGTYEMKAKTVTSAASSEYGPAAYVGYGESPDKQAANGNRSDINKDGKVNLVDFSILLSHWTGSDEDADINQDGAVNLSDFSILLFNWTG